MNNQDAKTLRSAQADVLIRSNLAPSLLGG